MTIAATATCVIGGGGYDLVLALSYVRELYEYSTGVAERSQLLLDGSMVDDPIFTNHCNRRYLGVLPRGGLVS